jgi:outer membrane protein assembly factor BamB
MKRPLPKGRVLLQTFFRLCFPASIVVLIHALSATSAFAIERQQILAASKVHGGVMIHLGCRDTRLLTDFARDSQFIVQGLTSDARLTARLRASLTDKKLSGKASVRTAHGTRLPYVDHLVRFLIVEDPLGIPESELNRVLCPGGVLARKSASGWSISTQPWPETMDEWTHVRHGADGNLVSRDQLVGAPTNVRWIAESPPTTSMSQDVVIVSCGGRLLTVAGNRPAVLFARDAFSGIVLWKRNYDLPSRRFSHRAFWDRPPLIAVGERVFIAGEAIDAATGDSVFSFKGNPVACDSGVLLTSTMQALNIKTGKEIWQHDELAAGLAISNGQVYLVVGNWPAKGGSVELLCLDLKTGKEKWRNEHAISAPDTKSGRFDGYAPKTTPNGLLAGVVIHRGVMALEVSRTYLHLFATKDGHHLRSLRYKNWSPYAAGLRALMKDNQLWLPEYVKGETFDYGLTINAYSLDSGKLSRSVKLATPIRQRCRPPLATGQFMYLGGMNSVDLKSGASESMPIVRSACGIGVVPANGLIYVPPTHCRCYAMISGYVALESRWQMGQPLAKANSKNHLEKGPAYDSSSTRKAAADDASGKTSNDWPAFRQDFMREAHVKAALPNSLKLKWTYKLPGARFSSPVARGSSVLVTVENRHRIDAIDIETGKRKWSFVAAGPITGSPTIAKSVCLFGCRDGWVYAVRLSDGLLAWRNLAAPEERQIVAIGQLESAWPSLGPVIVAGDTICAVAGRHNMAEGGIVITGFDLPTGNKVWQTEAPHRPLSNLLTGGAFARKSLKPDPRPTSAALGGWLVSNGSTVQIDRLGAFDVTTGQPRELFDTRLDHPYKSKLRSLKNGARRSDFGPWLLSASDGKYSCKSNGQELEFSDKDATQRFRAPGEVRSLASAGDAWVVLTANRLLLIDKRRRAVVGSCEFAGNAALHGLAIAGDRVFVSTEDGRLLSVEKTPSNETPSVKKTQN